MEIKELERRIWDMLEAEKQENLEKEAEHKAEQENLFKESQAYVKKIADVLQSSTQ